LAASIQGRGDRTIEGARQHPERSAQHHHHDAGDTEPVGIGEPVRLMRADTARKQADADQQRQLYCHMQGHVAFERDAHRSKRKHSSTMRRSISAFTR
jgi:hypothetical protein